MLTNAIKPSLLCISTVALKSWKRNSGDKEQKAKDFLSEICKPGGPIEEALNYLKDKTIGKLPYTTVSLFRNGYILRQVYTLYYRLVRFNS